MEGPQGEEGTEGQEGVEVKSGGGRLRGLFDVEMFKKGWWMLLLILGSIAVLFTISSILVFRH